MKRFRFRLENILGFRESEKKETERVLAEKNAELREREEEVQNTLHEQEKDIPKQGEMSMAELALSGGYQERLRQLLEEQRELVKKAALAVDEAREAYIEKSIEAKTLETLKERKKEEYKEEAKREGRKELSDFVSQRYNKK